MLSMHQFPVELSHDIADEDKVVSISKDVALKSSKEYILRFNSEGKMVEENLCVFC